MAAPKISYLILASHRSGSTLLCELLSRTEVVGKPAEYFYHPQETDELADYAAYIQQTMTEHVTPNGVFGAKMMAGVAGGIAGILERLKTVSGLESRSDVEKIRAFFPNLKCIYLARRNRVAQAVSWWKLAQSGQGHLQPDDEKIEIDWRYDYDAIQHLLNEICMEDAAHQTFLDDHDMTALPVVYEDMVRDMRGTVAQIIAYLGIDDAYEFQPSVMRPLADTLSDEWIQRFRRECQAGWPNVRW